MQNRYKEDDLSWVKQSSIDDPNVAYSVHVFPNKTLWEKKISEIQDEVPHIVTEWGYNEVFLQIFDDSYNVTNDFVNDNTVYVMEQNNVIVGFGGLILHEQSAELEFLYIDSGKIRMGYGRHLWNHMSEWCRLNNIKRIDFVTSSLDNSIVQFHNYLSLFTEFRNYYRTNYYFYLVEFHDIDIFAVLIYNILSVFHDY